MNLENRVFYRLIRVVYILLIAAFFFAIAYAELTSYFDYRSDYNSLWDYIEKDGFKDTAKGILILFPLYYLSLNIIKETLIYIAFGKKFTWNWLFLKKKTSLSQ